MVVNYFVPRYSTTKIAHLKIHLYPAQAGFSRYVTEVSMRQTVNDLDLGAVSHH